MEKENLKLLVNSKDLETLNSIYSSAESIVNIYVELDKLKQLIYKAQDSDECDLLGGKYLEQAADNIILLLGRLEQDFSLWSTELEVIKPSNLSYKFQIGIIVDTLKEILTDINIFFTDNSNDAIRIYTIDRIKDCYTWLLLATKAIKK